MPIILLNSISSFKISRGKFKLTKKQAQAILETKLQQLTSLEHDKLKKEFQDLKQQIAELEKILGDIKEVLSIIVKEVNELKRKYGDNRRTQILQRVSEIEKRCCCDNN